MKNEYDFLHVRGLTWFIKWCFEEVEMEVDEIHRDEMLNVKAQESEKQ